MVGVNMAENSDDTVKTTERAIDILEYLLEHDSARLTDIAADLGLAKSTTHRHLQTLYNREYVVKEDERYYLSLRYLEFGEQARNRKEAYGLVQSKVDDLAEQTAERVQFIVEEHGKGVYVYRATGERAVQTDPGLGKRVELHSIAAGKAILAQLPEQRVNEILERHGLRKLTAQTLSSREELFIELDEIREKGYSINNQENVKGLRAIGVPIRERDGSVLGAVSISGPTNRIKGERFEDEIPDLLLGTANELELNIAYA